MNWVLQTNPKTSLTVPLASKIFPQIKNGYREKIEKRTDPHIITYRKDLIKITWLRDISYTGSNFCCLLQPIASSLMSGIQKQQAEERIRDSFIAAILNSNQ